MSKKQKTENAKRLDLNSKKLKASDLNKMKGGQKPVPTGPGNGDPTDPSGGTLLRPVN